MDLIETIRHGCTIVIALTGILLLLRFSMKHLYEETFDLVLILLFMLGWIVYATAGELA